MSQQEDIQRQLTCSFCGKAQDEVKKLIAGPAVYICDECIELCKDIIAEEPSLTSRGRASGNVSPSPPRSRTILDDYVIGQERAKKVLAVAVYNHYKRVEGRRQPGDVECRRATSC